MGYGAPITASLPSFGQTQWSGTLNTVLYAITGTLAQPVTPAGMGFTANLDMAGNALKDAPAAVLIPNVDAGVPRSLFFASTGSLALGELYIRDGANRPIRLTNSGNVNPATGGGFGGSYVASGALAAYSGSTAFTYYFTTSGSQYALANFNAAAGDFSAPLTGTLNIGTYGNFVQPSGGYALLESTSPGTLSTVQSGTVVQWIDAARAVQSAGVASYNNAGNNGWLLFQGGAIDVPIPFVQGDQLQSLIFTTNGNPVTGTLYGRIPFSLGGGFMPIAFIDSQTAIAVSMSNGATSMTGTLPYLTNSSSSLLLTIQAARTNTFVYNVQATWLRKLI